MWELGHLNHVAIAVPNLEKAVALYRDVFGGKCSAPQPLPEHGVTTVFVNLGNTKLELLHPLGDKSPIKNYLDKNKDGGIHHVCIEVKDIHAALAGLKASKVRMIIYGVVGTEPHERAVDSRTQRGAQDWRARQASGLPPPQGLQRRPGRAGARVILFLLVDKTMLLMTRGSGLEKHSGGRG